MAWIVWIIVAIIGLAAIGIFSFGFKQVQQHERWIIERFGAYSRTLKPGLNWIVPFVEQVRAVVSTQEMIVPIFEQVIKIDFRDGSATPRNAVVFVRIKDVDTRYGPPGRLGRDMTGAERAIYEIQNWRTGVKDRVENAARSYLNNLTIDEGITLGRAGFDLKNQLPPEEKERLDEILNGWGFEFLGVTVQDFDLELDLVKARGEVQIRRREAEAAEHVRARIATETVGVLIQMIAESTGKSLQDVQIEVENDPALKRRLIEFGRELITRQMSIAGKALTDIRVGGGGDDFSKGLMAIISAVKKA